MTSGGGASDVTLSLRLSLAGEPGVGKTALVRRFVSDTFDDTYIATLGAKVSSRQFSIPDPRRSGRTVQVAAAIWDIMGHLGLGEVLRDVYFRGAQGVLLVADSTRPNTMKTLPAWGEAVRSVAGPTPIVVLMNKNDLADQAKVTQSQVESLCAAHGWSWMMTSAKTGENVAAAFERLASLHLKKLSAKP